MESLHVQTRECAVVDSEHTAAVTEAGERGQQLADLHADKLGLGHTPLLLVGVQKRNHGNLINSTASCR
jgi:hypothetical protein